MKSRLLLFLFAALLVSTDISAPAADLSTVWEFLINKPGVPVPPMTNYFNDVTDSDLGDGHSVLDTIGPLRRYDNNRLLLGIRENGVDESAGILTAGQLWVSTNYPDRSLIWINPTNGQPMGIALKMGLYPVPLDSWFITNSIATGTPDYTNQYYWSFDVSADGRVYTGYKNKILRYDPDGSGGISPVPHVVFTLTTNDAAHGYLYSISGRFPMVRVRGTGTNTVILAGGVSSTRGAYRLATTDGTNFFSTSWLPGGWASAGSGCFSSLIPSPSPSALSGEEWVYGSWYPGSSTGADSQFGRMFTASPYADPANDFAASSGFTAAGDPGSASNKYTANFVGCVDAHKDLNLIVVYSTPSWNSTTVTGGNFLPGWLALEDRTTGDFRASHLLDVRESDDFLVADNEGKWEGNHGFLSLNKLPGGNFEVLWCSGVYGYGRYLINLSMQITNFNRSGGTASITFQGDGNGQVQRSTTLNSNDWQNVGVPTAPGTVVQDTSSPSLKAFYRVLLVP